MCSLKKYSVELDTEVEEGLTLRDIMVMAAESVLIKNGTIKPTSFEDAFAHLNTEKK